MSEEGVHVIARLRACPPPAGGAETVRVRAPSLLEIRNSASRGGAAGGAGAVVDNTLEWHRFALDGVLLGSASQEEVYEVAAADMVASTLRGVSSCLLAYGQTGSGKTHTMTGPRGGEYASRGVIPRCLVAVFAARERALREAAGRAFSVRLSYLEIYNDRLIDLLAAEASKGGASAAAHWSFASSSSVSSAAPLPSSAAALSVVEDGRGRVSVRGLSSVEVANEAEALDVLFLGEGNRAVAEHLLNEGSSRSHCVFTVEVEQEMVRGAGGGGGESEGGGAALWPLTSPEGRAILASSAQGAGPALVKVTSKLQLVDLAGSERVEKTASVGAVLREAKHINKSLSFLEQVVLALSAAGGGASGAADGAAAVAVAATAAAAAAPSSSSSTSTSGAAAVVSAAAVATAAPAKASAAAQQHIPYRSSKLTHVLKESLTRGKARLIATLRPEPAFADECVATLRFATRMMRVKTAPGLDVAVGPPSEGGGLGSEERARIVAAYEKEIAVLRAELAFQATSLRGAGGTVSSPGGGAAKKAAPAFGPLSADENATVASAVAAFLAEASPENTPAFPTARHYIEALHKMRAEVVRLQIEMAKSRVTGGVIGGKSGSGSAPLLAPPPVSSTAPLLTLTAPPHIIPPFLQAAAILSPEKFGLASSSLLSSSASSASAAASSLSSLHRSAAADSSTLPGGGAAFDSADSAPAPPPEEIRALTSADEAARSEALAKWCAMEGPTGGARLHGELAAAKRSVKERKAAYAALAADLNKKKSAIDAAASKLAAGSAPPSASSAAAAAGGDKGGPSSATVDQLSADKKAFRAQYEQVVDCRKEVEYLERVVKQLGAEIAAAFQVHLESK